jgi:hypothetical protein
LRKVLVRALAGAGALAAFLLVVTVGVAQSGQPTRAALIHELSRGGAPPEVLAFYRARADQPLWTHSYGLWPLWTGTSLGPEAAQMVSITATALPGEISGPTTRQVAAAVAGARSGRPQAAAQAEVALSAALGEYGRGRPGGSRLLSHHQPWQSAARRSARSAMVRIAPKCPSVRQIVATQPGMQCFHHGA